MPMFDFICAECKHEFETLVRGAQVPACPACQSTKLKKQLSIPAIKTGATHGLAMQAAKRRDKAQGGERMAAQREYELNHDD